MNTYRESSYWVRIYIAGDLAVIEYTCRAYVTQGLCVNVTPNKYIYKYGEETGAIIELIQYPKYPDKSEMIWAQAECLANSLLDKLHAGSYTIMDSSEVYTFDRR